MQIYVLGSEPMHWNAFQEAIFGMSKKDHSFLLIAKIARTKGCLGNFIVAKMGGQSLVPQRLDICHYPPTNGRSTLTISRCI